MPWPVPKPFARPAGRQPPCPHLHLSTMIRCASCTHSHACVGTHTATRRCATCTACTRIRTACLPVHGRKLPMPAEDQEFQVLGPDVDLVHFCLQPVPAVRKLCTSVHRFTHAHTVGGPADCLWRPCMAAFATCMACKRLGREWCMHACSACRGPVRRNPLPPDPQPTDFKHLLELVRLFRVALLHR